MSPSKPIFVSSGKKGKRKTPQKNLKLHINAFMTSHVLSNKNNPIYEYHCLRCTNRLHLTVWHTRGHLGLAHSKWCRKSCVNICRVTFSESRIPARYHSLIWMNDGADVRLASINGSFWSTNVVLVKGSEDVTWIWSTLFNQIPF